MPLRPTGVRSAKVVNVAPSRPVTVSTFLARRRAALAELLGRAVARGELTAAQAASAVDLIYGSLWYRLIFDVGPLDRTWADTVAEAVAGPLLS